MNMFGINRYVAGALIASVLLVWGYVTYRVVAYSHLKRDHKEQAQAVDTVKRAQGAVSGLDDRLAKGETTIDKELCKRGWMASCGAHTAPVIMQFAHQVSALAGPPSTPEAEGSGGSKTDPSTVDGAQPSPPLPPLPPARPSKPDRKHGKNKAYASTPCARPLK
jgi:hypothetical protein